MYRTIQSSASLTADTTITRPGLVNATPLLPVLCCPTALVAALGIVQAAVIDSAVNAAENDPCSQGECTDAAASICTSSLYVSPGRLSARGPRVSDNASVDDLLSAVRGDIVSV
jgi:hypothetical protein